MRVGITSIPSLTRELFTHGSGTDLVSSGSSRCDTLGVPGWELPRSSTSLENPGKIPKFLSVPELDIFTLSHRLLPKLGEVTLECGICQESLPLEGQVGQVSLN